MKPHVARLLPRGAWNSTWYQTATSSGDIARRTTWTDEERLALLIEWAYANPLTRTRERKAAKVEERMRRAPAPGPHPVIPNRRTTGLLPMHFGSRR